jgi:hypothetical protein
MHIIMSFRRTTAYLLLACTRPVDFIVFPLDLLMKAPGDTASPAASVNCSDATQSHHPRQRSRPISRLPSYSRNTRTPTSLLHQQERERERVVYCLCGGHEYGLVRLGNDVTILGDNLTLAPR